MVSILILLISTVKLTRIDKFPFKCTTGRINIIYAFIILVCLCSCSANKLTNKGVYKELEPAEYDALLKVENVNIIDVRTKGEFKKSHIKGAVNASYFSGKFLKLVEECHLDTNKTTLIYCETQHRSPIAAKRLYKVGFNKIIDLKKGMIKWRKLGFSYVTTIQEHL